MRVRLWGSVVRSAMLLALGMFAESAHAAVSVPAVTGPLASDPRVLTSHNYTFFATDLDLAGRGYVEEEFFVSGTANVYDVRVMPVGIGQGSVPSPTANVVSTGHPYLTRIVVRRPARASSFNGSVVVEWTNVTSGYDVEALWFRAHEFFMRSGYAWVGVSAQSSGLSAKPNGLKTWSPVRYGALDVTDGGQVASDGLSYDIFSQAVQAVRSVPAVLGGLPVRQVLAAGVSQSAGRLGIWVNAVHPRDPVVDAVLLYIGGERIREDLAIPVLKLLSETEFTPSVSEIASLQPDTDKIRVWKMAGTSHSDWASYVVRYAILRRDLPAVPLFDSCLYPSRSRIQDRFVIGAAIEALKAWAHKGTVPGHRQERAICPDFFEPPHSPEIQLDATGASPARDAYGNALGGIRLASFAVPIAMDQGGNVTPPGVSALCFLNGTHIPFEPAVLDALYPTHESYVETVRRATAGNVRDGFLLPEDAEEMVAEARHSTVGTGLICGELCSNEAQFPIHPSTSILRDHTKIYYFHGGDELLKTMDWATYWVAKGYTVSGKESQEAFGRAVGALQMYIKQVARLQALGRAAPESAALLTDYANTLIAKLWPLTGW